IYGPAAGVILTVIVSFVQSFMIHGSGGWIGFVMHVVATGAMAIVLGNLYKYSKKTRASAALGLTAGTLTMVVAMVGMNLVLTPVFMGTPIDAVLKMLVPVIIPFNIIKAGLNSVVTFILYKYVHKLVVK
ncbi:MAG: ECF transporter S component, partial [Oscillospiraceae bacterium]|nr:ECF transporter S component [Oscillospiraceae bacterium]